ncbi:PKD domain-containing protein [Neolewinella antarctica]|uniref:Gliding motility-associated-like protein n=1 Tax=Neolewinella antarctica TaxID=442734 RepID=A0ABX0X5X0_9BACT|nr:PKD domain-containing protein [Neolewinella antarctica]NJC24582.1 gliding motility-associated-like protein [Neolewinella antarctica]
MSNPITRINYLLLLFLLVAPCGLRAGHIVGGEFTYACRGWLNDDPDTGIRVYDVRINMYRDNIGQGAYFDGLVGTAPGGEQSVPGHITVYRGLQVVQPATRSITLGPVSPIPLNLGNPCLVLTERADQQVGIYDFTLELPIADESYTLTYQRCCRNGAIRNLVNAEEIGSTYFIEITPEAQRRCNASPNFNIDPPIAICVNEAFEIDLGATDRENDSLVYKLCSPVLGGGTDGLNGTGTATTFDDVAPLIESPPPYQNATFIGPRFSLENQLGVGSVLELNNSTGLLSGQPIFRGTYAVAICVEEWSRDPVPILLSETKREFQLIVNLCENQVNADLLTEEIDSAGRFFVRQCGPVSTIFNESTDQAFISSYSWTVQGPNGEVTGTDRDFASSLAEPGVYEGRMILNANSRTENCRDTADFLLGVFPDLAADFEFADASCEVDPVAFTNFSSTSGNNTISDYAWDFADDSETDRRINPTHFYDTAGLFPVTLTIVDNNRCRDSTTIDVPYFPAPTTIILGADRGFGCKPFTKQFENLSRPLNDDYVFDWDFGDGGSSTEANPTHVYENSGNYDVYLGITSPTGCFVERTFPRLIDVRDAPTAGFTWEPEEVTNLAPNFRVFDASIDASGRRYTITNAAGRRLFTTPAPDFDYQLRDTSLISITQLVAHPSGCVDTLTQNLRLRFVNVVNVPNAFTPNGDGLNDAFFPVGSFVEVSDYLFRVWTRWGELIYSTPDPEASWDGTFNGALSPGGGYLWDLEYIDNDEASIRMKGGVVLVR